MSHTPTNRQYALISRSLCFYIGYALSLALLTTTVFPLLFSRHLTYIYLNNWNKFAIFWLRVCCGITHRIVGIKNLPNEPSVILCRHQSSWETIFLSYCFDRTVSFVVKRELFLIPFFGWGLFLLSPIGINRKNRRDAMQRITTKGTERIRQGRHVIIFPEGTRRPYNKPATTYGISGVALAQHAQAPIVPVTHNAGKYWPAHRFIKYPGVITLHIGPPISYKADHPKDIAVKARDWSNAHTVTE